MQCFYSLYRSKNDFSIFITLFPWFLDNLSSTIHSCLMKLRLEQDHLQTINHPVMKHNLKNTDTILYIKCNIFDTITMFREMGTHF